MSRRRRGFLHLLQLLPGLAVLAVCLWFLIRDVDWGTVGERFGDASWVSLPVMGVLLVGFFALKAVRWRLLLMPVSVMRTGEVAGPLLIGFMANNILPAHLGELVRVHVMGRTRQVSRAAVFSTVVLERLFDLVAILTFLAVGMLADPRLRQEYHEAVITVAGITAAVLAGAVLFVFATDGCVRVVTWVSDRWLGLLPERWREGLVEMVTAAARGLGALRQPGLAAGIVATSFAQWLLMGAMVWVSLVTMGADGMFLPSLVVVGVIAVAILLPAPPGYIGVIQFCFISVLGLYGLDSDTAMAASVYYHLWQFIPVTCAGLWCLTRTGLGWGEVMRAAEPEDEGG
ncbi:MAG: lysylphosphatidylglycerol synthase transmembrane domain-containing protein [Planctomycetaceae bacterium]